MLETMIVKQKPKDGKMKKKKRHVPHVVNWNITKKNIWLVVLLLSLEIKKNDENYSELSEFEKRMIAIADFRLHMP